MSIRRGNQVSSEDSDKEKAAVDLETPLNKSKDNYHYLGKLEDSDDTDAQVKKAKSGKSQPTQSKQKAIYGVIGASLGTLLTMIAVISFLNGAQNADAILRAGGWGMTIFFCSSLWLLLTQVKSSDQVWKNVAVSGLSGFISLLTLNATFFAFSGSGVLCSSWYPFYDPDIGFCPCDDRALLSSSTSAVFDTSSSLASLFEPIRIATIGDIELSNTGRRTLEMVKGLNPEVLVINGDLTYKADPVGLGRLLDEIFGDEIPVLITVGNHDTGIFTEYQNVMLQRYDRYVNKNRFKDPLEVFRCSGFVGVDEFCSFKNLGFVFSGLGSSCGSDRKLLENLESQLQTMEDENLIWRNVFIHKNRKLLQTGDKTDEVDLEAYEAALRFGALMTNSHEHQYVRTHQLSSIGSRASDFEFSEPVDFIQGKPVLSVSNGQFFVVANGLGGKSLRDPDNKLLQNPWWATTFHEFSEDANYGATICEFNFNGETDLAFCFFQTVDGVVVDEYFIRSNH